MEFVMSRKNRNLRTTPTPDGAIDGDRHLHAVADAPGQRNAPTTEDKVREALTANPGATTAALAMAAGVGRSTAAKVLARWGRDGTATRTAGDGPRNPDTWALALTDRDTDVPGTEDTRPDTTTSDTADDTEAANEPASDADTAPDDAAIVNTTAMQETATGPAADCTPESTAADTTSDEDGSAISSDVDNDTSTLPDTAPETRADSETATGPSAAESPVDTDTAVKDKDRLPKGGLRALVEDYLAEHPGESFGPAKIGKDLGRSGGAVNNALEKLVADGYARKTCEAPKRFAIDPDKTDVSAPSDGTEPALKA
ncbi:hypothetical protein [Amycolatopsis keratiniphila]|uniref:hypothetical protein n=1 Tax=Amycolatopsis keratiniphila TaxID=129921 RepID=UPI001E36C80E|nr:hypothetical protein [Amycolatopsis keratiniphila]